MPTTRIVRTSAATRSARPAQLKSYFAAKLSAELGPHNLKRMVDAKANDFLVLDVRAKDAFEDAHIPGAKSIPFEDLPGRLKELPKDKEIITYCWDPTCNLSTKAAYVIAAAGFRVKEMLGGIAVWQQSKFPISQG